MIVDVLVKVLFIIHRQPANRDSYYYWYIRQFWHHNNDLPATIEEEDDNNNNNDAVELELSFYPSRSYILPTGTTNPWLIRLRIHQRRVLIKYH